MPRGLAPSEKREYIQRYYEEKEEEPAPTLQLAPKPAPAPAEMPPFVGPKTGRIDYQAQPTSKEEAIEREIASVYAEAPIVGQRATTIQRGARPGAPITVQVYQPTPQQEEKIISLAMQLPPEKREKYIVEPPEEPKGIAETLISVRMEDVSSFIAIGVADVFGLKGERRETFLGRHAAISPYLQPQVAPFKEPVQTLAGMVASVEAPVYTVGRLVGLKTPRPPPTITGGLVSTVLGQPQELARVEELGPSYGMGTVMGDILVSLGIGKGAEKTWVVAKKVTPEFIKHPFYQTVKFGRVAKLAHKVKLATPSYRGSRLDVFLAKHSKWYYKTTKGIARGEVALPLVSEPISMAKLKASMGAWEMTQVPRTGGVWIGKVAVAPIKTKVLPHLISRGGLVSVGFLREVSYDAEPYWRRGLLPFVTQQQVTRLGLIPYIPKMVSTTGKKGVSMIGASLALTVPRLVVSQVPKLQPRKKMVVTPKVWQPTFTYEREKFRPLTLEVPGVKQRERLVPALKLPQIQEQPQAQKLEVPTLQIQQQLQKVTLDWPRVPPTSSTQKRPFYPFIPRGGRDVSRDPRGLWGKWFKREHKIATPEEVARRFFGLTKPRKKKRKGKRKRRKGGVLLRF